MIITVIQANKVLLDFTELGNYYIILKFHIKSNSRVTGPLYKNI